MTTRITQLIARLIGLALTAVAGWLGAEQAEAAQSITDLSGAMAAAVVAIGAFMIDLLIHKFETGSLLARAGGGPSRGGPSEGGPSGGSTSGGGRSPLMVLAPLVLLPTLAGGCAATPTDQWYLQRQALNTANETLLALAPELEPEQVVFYGELLQAARHALDEARTQLPDGGALFEANLQVAEAILARWAQLEAQRHDPSRDPRGAPDGQSAAPARRDRVPDPAQRRARARGRAAAHPARGRADRRGRGRCGVAGAGGAGQRIQLGCLSRGRDLA